MTTTWLPAVSVCVSPSLPGLKSKHTVTGMRSLSKILWLVVGTWWFQPKSSHDWMMRIQKFRWKYYLFSVEFFSSSPWVKQLPKRLVKLYLNHQLFWGTSWDMMGSMAATTPTPPWPHQNSSQGLRATACKVHTMCNCNQNAVLICFSWFVSCCLQDFATIKISVPFTPRHPVQQISNPPVPPVRASSSSSWRPLGSGKPWNGNEFLFIAYIVEPFQLWIVW